MMIRKIKGHTATIGADQGYLALPIRKEAIRVELKDGKTWNTFRVLTAWEPTPKELMRINAGESIIVSLIAADPFPPIELTVDFADKVEGANGYNMAIEDMIDSMTRFMIAMSMKSSRLAVSQLRADQQKAKLLQTKIQMYEKLIHALQEEMAE